MSQLNIALREAADRNRELIAELAATDYAVPSLKQNISYVSDLQSQIAKIEKELTHLHKITEDERKDHVNYRDSNVKRWMHKLQGSKGKDKFASKQEKEEREFLEAWQKERSAKETREELILALSKAEQDKVSLEKDSARQQQAQAELDALYDSIFSGPTPDVPGEDQYEQAVSRNRSHFEGTKSYQHDQLLAMSALDKASGSLQNALKNMGDALRYSTRDMFGGGTFTDMMERDALALAQNFVDQSLRHMKTAQHYQPAIRALNEINIDHGHFFSDIMFDNVFTDMAQHERIQRSDVEMKMAWDQLQYQVVEQRERLKEAEKAMDEAGKGLESSRVELQRVRAEAFAKIAMG